MGGWGLKLISTQVVVEVEVGVELGNISLNTKSNFFECAIYKLQLKPLKKGKNILDDNNCWLTNKGWAQKQNVEFSSSGGGGGGV